MIWWRLIKWLFLREMKKRKEWQDGLSLQINDTNVCLLSAEKNKDEIKITWAEFPESKESGISTASLKGEKWT